MKPTNTFKRLRVPSVILYYVIITSYICAFVQKVFCNISFVMHLLEDGHKPELYIFETINNLISRNRVCRQKNITEINKTDTTISIYCCCWQHCNFCDLSKYFVTNNFSYSCYGTVPCVSGRRKQEIFGEMLMDFRYYKCILLHRMMKTIKVCSKNGRFNVRELKRALPHTTA